MPDCTLWYDALSEPLAVQRSGLNATRRSALIISAGSGACRCEPLAGCKRPFFTSTTLTAGSLERSGRKNASSVVIEPITKSEGERLGGQARIPDTTVRRVGRSLEGDSCQCALVGL